MSVSLKKDKDLAKKANTSEGVGKENKIYTQRFSEKEQATREATWKVLCEDFFSKYISKDSTVIDIGAGDSLFLKNISAKRKIAVDLSEHVLELEDIGVEVHKCLISDVTKKLSKSADIVFMSNFLEHLPSKKILLEVIEDAKKLLKEDGKLLILQPNIRYVGSAYWDYVDHHIAITEHSLVEALEVSGYKVDKLIPRFLPYTSKSKVGAIAGFLDPEKLAKNYLKFPILWKFFGAQTFVVASKV